MEVKTFRPDDPALAEHIRSLRGRGDSGTPPVSNFSPRFGDHIAGRLDAPPEKKMAEVERAKKEEVVKLPDGRQIQIQAKGAPVVDESLAERERQLAQAAHEEVDHLTEIQPEEGSKALSTGTVPVTKSRPLTTDTPKK